MNNINSASCHGKATTRAERRITRPNVQKSAMNRTSAIDSSFHKHQLRSHPQRRSLATADSQLHTTVLMAFRNIVRKQLVPSSQATAAAENTRSAPRSTSRRSLAAGTNERFEHGRLGNEAYAIGTSRHSTIGRVIATRRI